MTTKQAVALVLVVFAILLRLASMNNVASRTPDERVFTKQATDWIDHGDAGIRANVVDYENNPSTRQYPAPTRVGMARLTAIAIEWTGSRDAGTGAVVSCAASILSVVIFAALGLRFFSTEAFLFALLFNAVSPMQLMMARRTWADSLVEMFSLAMVWAACEISAGSKRILWYVIFAVAAGVGITVKEYMAFPGAVCAVWILCVLLARKQHTDALKFAGIAAAGVALAVIWMSISVGGVGELLTVATSISGANATNSYALQYASGPAYLMLVSFWLVTPLTAVLSVVGLTQSLHTTMLRGLAAFTLAILLFVMVQPHMLNLRYVAPMFGPFYLFAGVGFACILQWSRRWFGAKELKVLTAIITALLVVDAGMDYLRFKKEFVDDGTPDMTIKFLQDENARQ